MLCCIVLLALIGFVFRRGQAEQSFPPPARRNVAGDPVATVAAEVRHEPVAPTSVTAAWPALMRGGAIGVLVYVVAVTLLIVAGVAEPRQASDLLWLVRDLLFAAVAVAGLAIAGRVSGGPSHYAHRIAVTLIGAGIAWTVIGIVDMHVFAMFEFAHSEALHDSVFHAAGFWVVVAGSLLLNRSSAGISNARSARWANHGE